MEKQGQGPERGRAWRAQDEDQRPVWLEGREPGESGQGKAGEAGGIGPHGSQWARESLNCM